MRIDYSNTGIFMNSRSRIFFIKFTIISIIILIIPVLSPSILESKDFNKNEQEAELQVILSKAAEYCDRLDKIYLHFICTEEIKEKIYHPFLVRGHQRRLVGKMITEINNYLYDYQIVKTKTVEESRILLKENGKTKQEKNAQLKTKRFFHKFVVFGPIGILSKNSQKEFHFTYIKEKKLWGKKSVLIEITPKVDSQGKKLFGKVWIDKSEYSIMKIEWNQNSMSNFGEVVTTAALLVAEPKITFSSEYRFEKNGIRFPSRYIVRENYVRSQEILAKSELIVKYKEYKFFIVETEIKC